MDGMVSDLLRSVSDFRKYEFIDRFSLGTTDSAGICIFPATSTRFRMVSMLGSNAVNWLYYNAGKERFEFIQNVNIDESNKSDKGYVCWVQLHTPL